MRKVEIGGDQFNINLLKLRGDPLFLVANWCRNNNFNVIHYDLAGEDTLLSEQRFIFNRQPKQVLDLDQSGIDCLSGSNPFMGCIRFWEVVRARNRKRFHPLQALRNTLLVETAEWLPGVSNSQQKLKCLANRRHFVPAGGAILLDEDLVHARLIQRIEHLFPIC